MIGLNGKFLVVTLAVLISTAAKADDVTNTFTQHEVVPDVIKSSPSALLKITYDGELAVDKGNELTPTQVKNQPKVEYATEDSAYYTLIMTDPDAPSRVNPKFREFKHWIVTNIPGDKIEQGEVLAAYIGAGPPEGTGLHRYVFLLYKQPGKLKFDEQHVGNDSRVDRPKFKAADFAKKYDLGDPIAGNFFQAQFDDYVPKLHSQLSG